MRVNRRRSEIEIIADMLEIGENGAGKTQIMYSANMSYHQIQKYLGYLVANGYVDKMKMGNKGIVAVLDKPEGKFELKEYPLPEPAPGTILVKQELTGICGTDIHMYHGRLPGITYPICLGHEFMGKIAALGNGVTTDYLGKPVKEGDRVIVV